MATRASSKKTVSVAMIGAGGMANRVHYPSLASFDDVKIAAISDLNPERLNTAADKYSVDGRYADYRKMVEETAPDAVYAIGPPHMMYDIWVWCLQQGLNLYIEKPMGITLHQAKVLAHMAEEKGCLTQVSFQRRSTPMVKMLHEKCLERGPIVHAICRFYKNGIAPHTSALGHMMNDGVHALDTLRWMCGGEVVKVNAMCKSVAVPDVNFISALVEFSTGAVGFVVNSWSSGRRVFDVEMHGMGVYAQAEHEGKGYLFADGDYEGLSFDSKEFAGSDELHVFAGFAAKNRDFIDAIKSGRQPESNFSDAVKTMELADEILSQPCVGA